MRLARLIAAVALAASLGGAAGCGGSQRPKLQVLGVEKIQQAPNGDGRQIKLFVEVTNYAGRPMKLQRLQYEFAPNGKGGGGGGEVELSRTIEPGAAIVVEVPITVTSDLANEDDLQLNGQLITEQDQIVKAYPVTAEVGDEAEASLGVGEPSDTEEPVDTSGAADDSAGPVANPDDAIEPTGTPE